LTGKWEARGGQVVADNTAERIQALVANHLIKVGEDLGDWDVLYRDPDDGRLWELLYPQSELHGGGPPELRLISDAEARKKYPDASFVRR
jgi:hypothetical protein